MVGKLRTTRPYDGPNGKLYVVGNDGLPFDVKRVFWIADVPKTAIRGEHAHRTCQQAFFAVSGSWRVRVTAPDGKTEDTILEPGEDGIIVPTMHWIEVKTRKGHGELVVLCSEEYKESSYIREQALWRHECEQMISAK